MTQLQLTDEEFSNLEVNIRQEHAMGTSEALKDSAARLRDSCCFHFADNNYVRDSIILNEGEVKYYLENILRGFRL